MTKKQSMKLGLIVAVLVIAVDQISKWWIVNKVMQPPTVIPVTSFFNIVMAWNRGVSFGMFNSGSYVNNLILPAVAMIIVGVLINWLRKSEKRWVSSAIGLIIGGAVGNVVDRFHYGAVADFLDFHISGYHWPAFNVADSAICVGALFLVVDSLFSREKKTNIKE